MSSNVEEVGTKAVGDAERSLVATVTRLVQTGGERLEEPDVPRALAEPRLLVLGATGIALFGAANGLAQGGPTIGWAAVKCVVVAAFSLVLAAPSLIVLQALDDVGWRERGVGRVLVRAWATVGVTLAALAPISFLFATSSRLLGSVIVIAILFVLVAAGFVRRLMVSAGLSGASSTLWIALVVMVALQSSTLARPMLHRAPGEPLWGLERSGPFEQFSRATRVRLVAPQSGAQESAAQEPSGRP